MIRENKTPGRDKHIKGIYDLLNRGCNKKAVQDIDKLPKKLKDDQLFKALKALALIRMYKRKQAFDILDEIDPEDDLDEVTLQTMTSCYKESVDVARIIDLYEAASKRRPNNVEIMSRLFMAYVRVFNFKKQKEIALQMYRNFSEKRRLYSFWAIMSLVMQSQQIKDIDNDSLLNDKKVSLSLAEKMSEKMIDDERTNEEIELYLMILRKQNKHEEEYRFLTGPICARITDHLSWFNRRRAYLCLDLKMYSRAFKHYFPSLITEYPDQIEYYTGLFKSAFLLDTEAPSQQQPVALNDQQSQSQNTAQQAGTPVKSTSALAECFDIVERQCNLAQENSDQAKDSAIAKVKNQLPSKALSRTSSLNNARKRLLRGPFMAKIKLYYTILSNEKALPPTIFNMCKNQFSNGDTTIVSLLTDYFQSFCKKTICFLDIEKMIDEFRLSAEDKQQLVDSIGEWVRRDVVVTQSEPVSSIDSFSILMNYHLLKHSLTNYKLSDSLEERFKTARIYLDLYDKNKELGKKCCKTEFQPIDYYCLLVINSIMTNAIDLTSTNSLGILNDSIISSLLVFAENASSFSSSNHQLKLTLLKLFSLIGVSKQCSNILLTLDIKHFQIDTLGHLLNPVLYNTGHYALSKESLDTCLDFYAHGVRECFEGLTTSYRDGRFSKIEEISGVLRKLSDSLNATQCILLRGMVSNLSAESLDELHLASQSFDPFKSLHRMFRCPDSCYTLSDNRDFKVLRSYHAGTDELIRKKKIETLDDERLWLKLRFYLLKSVYIQLDYFTDWSIAGCKRKEALGEELTNAREQVAILRPQLDEAAMKSCGEGSSFFEPEPSPLRWPYIDFRLLISLVSSLAFVENLKDLTIDLQENYCSTLDSIISNLESQISSINSLIRMKQSLSSLTLVLEFVSLAITSLVSIYHQLTNNSSNSKKQASQSLASNQTGAKHVVQQMIGRTEGQLNKLLSCVKNIEPRQLVDSVAVPEISLFESLNVGLGRQNFDKMKEKIIDSYMESLREIESTLKKKLKLLRHKEISNKDSKVT